jgi:hypothetical protein
LKSPAPLWVVIIGEQVDKIVASIVFTETVARIERLVLLMIKCFLFATVNGWAFLTVLKLWDNEKLLLIGELVNLNHTTLKLLLTNTIWKHIFFLCYQKIKTFRLDFVKILSNLRKKSWNHSWHCKNATLHIYKYIISNK